MERKIIDEKINPIRFVTLYTKNTKYEYKAFDGAWINKECSGELIPKKQFIIALLHTIFTLSGVITKIIIDDVEYTKELIGDEFVWIEKK